jgi:two-component system KDP operon response regulator KdpE
MRQIWIVDDDDDMAHAIRLMLQLLDFETHHFRNARLAAAQLLAGKHPDLMVLDVNMPEVNGIMLLEFVRRRKEWQDLPVIMLSSEATDVQIVEALNLGADAYVTKPVSIEELEVAIQTAFKNHGKI